MWSRLTRIPSTTSWTGIVVAPARMSTSRLSWLGSRCWTSTKARPVSTGMAETSSLNASRPPADAPMPTTRSALPLSDGCPSRMLVPFLRSGEIVRLVGRLDGALVANSSHPFRDNRLRMEAVAERAGGLAEWQGTRARLSRPADQACNRRNGFSIRLHFRYGNQWRSDFQEPGVAFRGSGVGETIANARHRQPCWPFLFSN